MTDLPITAEPTDRPAPSTGDAAASDLKHLREALTGLRVAMLTTVEPGGLLTSKPMHLLEQDALGRFWFYCQDPQPTGGEANPYERANLSFSDAGSSRHVSVACRGELVRDRARIHALWSVAAKPWFPDGPDSPGLVCLQLVPLQAELWEGPGNGMTRALAFAASVMTGRPVGMGEHRRLDGLAPG